MSLGRIMLLVLLAPLSACATYEDIERMDQGLHRRLDLLSANLRAAQAQLDAQGKHNTELVRSMEALKSNVDGQLKDVRRELGSMRLTNKAVQDVLIDNVRQAMSPISTRLEQLTQSQVRAYRMEEAALQQRLATLTQMLRDMDGPRTSGQAVQPVELPMPQEAGPPDNDPPVEERIKRTRQ